MKTTTRYAIGSSLSAPKTIAIVAGRTYYMGASSSPERIFVLSVQGDAVYYYRCADLTYNRQATARVRIERWIAEDLIARGMASRLATLKTSNAPLRTPAWVPAEIARIEALIAGQETAPEYLETYLGETITLVSTLPGDAWYVAEEYGNVGGITLPDGTEAYEVRTTVEQARAAKLDPRFRVVS